MGRAGLDNRLGAHPDLVDYFTGDQLLEAARIYGQEKAMLAGGLPELSQRHRDLARVADGLDKDWAIVTTVEHGAVVHTLRAKHARAAEISPITLRVKTEFGPQHQELAAAFRRVVGFGAEEPLTLPPETVRELTIAGPTWLAAPDGPAEVSFVPARPLVGVWVFQCRDGYAKCADVGMRTSGTLLRRRPRRPASATHDE